VLVIVFSLAYYRTAEVFVGETVLEDIDHTILLSSSPFSER
jgi:hypothetical protein